MTEQELRERMVKKIKYIMIIKHIKQNKLAELTGIPRQTISRYLNYERKPTYDNIVRIAYALDCSLDELMGIEEELI